MQELTVQIMRLTGYDGPLPDYQSDHAAGMDIHAWLEFPNVIDPGRIEVVATGFAMAVPVGYEAQVRPRSGLASKHGITLPNSPGTIDADYRGPVKIPLINLGREPVTITPGMRIAQMLVCPVPRVQWQEVDSLDATPRGEGGFGHTGH